MKSMKNRVLSVFLIFFLFVALVTVASAGTETQLTQDERLTSGISFYDNHVFWTESAGNGVHAYDLTTRKRTDIEGGHAVESLTHTHGNKVVWTDADGKADSVYMYDVSTGNETKIASERRAPDIYGNYIVYTDSNYYSGQDHQNNGIYLYNLNTNNETKIVTVHGYPAITVHSYPAIYDKTVVWSQANNSSGYDICMYDICTHQTSTITTTNSSGYESQGLDIYGNVVVWIESGNLYMYDITAHKVTQVTNSGNAIDPAIYGKRIVYTLNRPHSFGVGDIYMYEMSTAKTTRITTSTCAFNPSIYGDKIVYADGRNSESPDVRDIYLYDLKPKN